jgi:hypothetical protein
MVHRRTVKMSTAARGALEAATLWYHHGSALLPPRFCACVPDPPFFVKIKFGAGCGTCRREALCGRFSMTGPDRTSKNRANVVGGDCHHVCGNREFADCDRKGSERSSVEPVKKEKSPSSPAAWTMAQFFTALYPDL